MLAIEKVKVESSLGLSDLACWSKVFTLISCGTVSCLAAVIGQLCTNQELLSQHHSVKRPSQLKSKMVFSANDLQLKSMHRKTQSCCNIFISAVVFPVIHPYPGHHEYLDTCIL